MSVATTHDPLAPVSTRVEGFTSGGMDISVEVFAPADRDEGLPVVVFLHGADGLSAGRFTTDYRRFATTLAGRGFVVAFPRYFERTGHGGRSADPITVLMSFLTWASTVDDAVGFAQALPEADHGRLALLGTSLGGTLAIDAAARDSRVKALVDVFGGFPDVIAQRVKRLPPTLILHGESDPVVPVGDSRRFAAHLLKLRVEHELMVYPRAGHGFTGADEADAIDRVAKFLEKHLL